MIRNWLSRMWGTLKRGWKLAGALTIAALVGAAAIGFALAGDEPETFRLRTPIPPSGEPFALALFQGLGVRMTPGHQADLLENGAVFSALEQESARARSSIHVVMYIWEKGRASDRISAALIERAKHGVACRVLVDELGSPDFVETVKPRLASAGCEVRVFRAAPTPDRLARNHRKIVIFDGRVAITGGFGIRDNWLGDGVRADGWRDTNVRFSGPAVLDAQQAFAENWQEAGGALLPRESFPAAEAPGPASAAFVASTASPVLTRAERLTQILIAAAKKRLWIANAYFVPSEGILQLLKDKASRGVDVRLLVPGKQDDSKTSLGAQHVEYGSLLERGVRVWEYAPSMMHAKTMLVDESVILVGSINLEPLSLRKLEEAALVVDDRALSDHLADTFRIDCTHAEEVRRQ